MWWSHLTLQRLRVDGPDRRPLTFAWNFVDGDAANGAIVSKTYPNGGGAFNVKLTVNDGESSPPISGGPPLSNHCDRISIVIAQVD